jgi:hypothetical protein
MNYKMAKIPSKGCPSTNVPIHCQLCPPNRVSGEPQTIWKYNAMYHIITENSLEDNILPPIPPEFMVELFIRQSEEDALGITEAETAEWRSRNQIPDSDVIDAMLPASSPPPFPASDPPAPEKRARADTGSTASDLSDSDRHKTKKQSI